MSERLGFLRLGPQVYVPDQSGERYGKHELGEILGEAELVVVVGVPGAGKSEHIRGVLADKSEATTLGYDDSFYLTRRLQELAAVSLAVAAGEENKELGVEDMIEWSETLGHPNLWRPEVWEFLEASLEEELETIMNEQEFRQVLIELPGVGKAGRGWEMVKKLFGTREGEGEAIYENRVLVVMVADPLIPCAALMNRGENENQQEAQPANREAIIRLMTEVLETARGMEPVETEVYLSHVPAEEMFPEYAEQFREIARLQVRYWAHKIQDLNRQARVEMVMNLPSDDLLAWIGQNRELLMKELGELYYGHLN